MPKLKKSIEQAMTAKPEKKDGPVAKQIQMVLSRHSSLPVALVESFYQCKTKGEVKRLLRKHLA
jgi:hypothetical protein